MIVKFRETEEGISLLVNEYELTLYIKDTESSESSYTVRNDFELSNDELDGLLKLNFSELPYEFDYYQESYYEINGAFIGLNINEYDISLRIEHALQNWANYYPFSKFNDVFIGLLSEGSYKINASDFSEVTVNLGIDKLTHGAMLPDVQKALSFIKDCSIESHRMIEETVRGDIFIRVFEFPEDYKNICSQYLMWFGEFLKNLGLEANVSTEQNGSTTQLIVSPNDCPELLLKVEKLFYQYLSLPYAELLPPESNLSQNDSFAFQSLIFQIQHLQTQIQLKDATIELQKLNNKGLNEQLSKKDSELLLLTSLKDDNKIEFLNGFIKVNKIQKIGKNGNVEVDLSPILKLLNK